MPTVRALFMLSPGLSGRVLSTAMWSRWSHVAPIIDDEEDCVIDATFLHGGVKRRSLSVVRANAQASEIRSFECPRPQDAYAWARAQIDKPYDWRGVLGIGIHREWQREDAWFCSEFFESMLAAGGNQRFIHDMHRVTVEHSYMVL